MIRGLASLYSPRYATALVYMLQSTEYQAGPYLRWYWRTTNFSAVAYRRTLERTRAARLLLLVLRIGMLLQIISGLALIGWWYWHGITGGWQFGLALVLAYPIVWAHLVTIPLALGRWLLVIPRRRRQIKRSEQTFKNHPGVRLAIVGSYGKTSMKELLLTILGEDKKVAATPANRNVAISHARFAQTLAGDEDIVLIEYGESAPGDIRRFARTTHPTHAIITGVAPAHLDHYRTVERAAADIFSITDFVPAANVYVNAESPLAQAYIKKNKQLEPYDHQTALGWKISNVSVAFDGTRFTMTRQKQRLELHSKLMGRHQVGPLAIAAALAWEWGLNAKQITTGVARTTPFEHRMQPYQLSGAWIIDDTYNGNIEGIRAGTALLKALPARRKWYVTPGLVDQGGESHAVHRQMGELIAAAAPDVVVLMHNSTTAAILEGLAAGNYRKETIIEEDPLTFYTNLHALIAAGDVVMMQNDWTDNYA